MDGFKKLFQVLLVLGGCGCICVAGIFTFIHVPVLLKAADLKNLGLLGGYLALAGAGIGLMLAAKRMSS